MHKIEQGVLQQSSLINLLIHILLLTGLFALDAAVAETTAEGAITAHQNSIQKHRLVIIYSSDSAIQTNITQTISGILLNKKDNIVISTVTPEHKTIALKTDTDLVIAIGAEGILSAEKNYPNNNKLFIASDPGEFNPAVATNKKNAVLYMTQSYCRQVNFIKRLNARWKVIGLLNSQEKPVDSRAIEQCASKYGMKMYSLTTTNTENLTDDIKDVLNHSDVLLALPNKNIYNNKTVKNILLSSYRYRKPIIAFSSNFTNAGALASIYSNTEQIAQSASAIIEQYYKLNHQFKNTVNHPQLFDITINKQVFRALDLTMPDIEKLKQTFDQLDTAKP